MSPSFTTKVKFHGILFPYLKSLQLSKFGEINALETNFRPQNYILLSQCDFDLKSTDLKFDRCLLYPTSLQMSV